MHWFHYPSLAGILLAVALPRLPLQYAPLVIAIVLHLLCDYALQTEWLCTKAANRNALVLHSALAGFIPLAGMGLAAGNPGFALVGGLCGFYTHLVIDHCNKFGLPLVPGLVLDQTLHLAVIVHLFMSF